MAQRDTAALLDYRRQAPFAERAHPTDEHLLPMYVALGAGGDDAIAQRIDAGVDLGFLAMDIYRFDSVRVPGHRTIIVPTHQSDGYCSNT